MKTRRIFVVVAALVLLTVAAAPAAEVGETIPEFELTTLDGRTIKSAEVKDRNSMMLMFWATWCPFCLKEIPRFQELYTTYGPKGMIFVAVNPGVNDSEAKIQQYLKKYSIDYPVALDKGAVVTKKFGVRGAPTIVVVDKSGIIRYKGGTIPPDFGERFAALEK